MYIVHITKSFLYVAMLEFLSGMYHAIPVFNAKCIIPILYLFTAKLSLLLFTFEKSIKHDLTILCLEKFFILSIIILFLFS